MATSDATNPVDTELHCPECDYNLTGAVEGRCPWCGWVIDETLLSTMALDRSAARRIGAGITCVVCGGGSLIGVASLVRHSTALSLRDGLAAVGVLIAVAGHMALAVLLLSRGRRWPIYRSDAGVLFRFAGWFSVVLAVVGATELLRSREVQGVPVAATFEFLLAGVFYALPGATLLVMSMVTFRRQSELKTSGGSLRRDVSDRAVQAPFSVDWVGRFDEANVRAVFLSEPGPSDPVVNAIIEQAWIAATALAEAENVLLYDGALLRLRRAAVDRGLLRFELGATSYKAFVGTNVNPGFVARADRRPFLANPLGISASVITRDGFIAYGRRGSRVAYQAGFVHPFGGMVDFDDRGQDGSVDLFGAMVRELIEEMGLTRADISDVVVLGLVRDRRLLQPELIFDVSVRCTRRELVQLFDPERSDGEHSEIEFLHDDPEAAIPSLSRFEMITPVAEAAYLLHGRITWGDEWYEQTCLIRYGEVPDLTGSIVQIPT